MSLAARYASLLAFSQSRAWCPTGPGGGKDNSCAAKPLDANDPEAVKQFLSQMKKETGLDIHGKPLPKGSPKPSVDSPSQPKSLEQQRLEAAGVFQDSSEKTSQQTVGEMKEYLRMSGIGWADFARKAQSHDPQKIKNATHAKKHAAKIFASEGASGLDRYLEKIGARSLARQ